MSSQNMEVEDNVFKRSNLIDYYHVFMIIVIWYVDLLSPTKCCDYCSHHHQFKAQLLLPTYIVFVIWKKMILGLQHHHYCVTCVVTTYAAVAVRCPFPIPLDSQSVTVVKTPPYTTTHLKGQRRAVVVFCGNVWKCVACRWAGLAGWMHGRLCHNASMDNCSIARCQPASFPASPLHGTVEEEYEEYTRLFMYILKLVPSSCVVLK